MFYFCSTCLRYISPTQREIPNKSLYCMVFSLQTLDKKQNTVKPAKTETCVLFLFNMSGIYFAYTERNT